MSGPVVICFSPLAFITEKSYRAAQTSAGVGGMATEGDDAWYNAISKTGAHFAEMLPWGSLLSMNSSFQHA